MTPLPQRIEPGPGQESVWDYPRPPRVEDSPRHIQVVFNGVIIADTTRARRVLETGHAPTYYVPPEDVRMEHFRPSPSRTICEWKGQAVYHTVVVGERTAQNAAWSYPNPTEPFSAIRVDGERVESQPGGFYGGWVTKDVVGPFKGGLGSSDW